MALPVADTASSASPPAPSEARPEAPGTHQPVDTSRRTESVVVVRDLVKSFRLPVPLRDYVRDPLGRARPIHEALRGVSLDVAPDECFGLLGPNGAGKTTLFKILSTLVRADGGSAHVAGFDVASAPSGVRRALTPVIADERSLNWRLSGVQNLELFASLYGVRSAREEALRLMETVGLDSSDGKMVGAYSSGMRQRLLIARALLSKPRVLLLDEPTRSLDPVGARSLRRFLREEVIGRQGCAVLLATHSPDEAFDLCDRLAILNRGQVVAQGTAAELERLASRELHRVVVAAESRGAARTLIESRMENVVEAEPTPDDDPEWVTFEGVLPGGAPAAAELCEALVQRNVRLAQLARVPLPLADMIELLVAKDVS